MDTDAQVGRPTTACNASNVEKVKREIKNRQKTIKDVADSTEISRTSIHKILW